MKINPYSATAPLRTPANPVKGHDLAAWKDTFAPGRNVEGPAAGALAFKESPLQRNFSESGLASALEPHELDYIQSLVRQSLNQDA